MKILFVTATFAPRAASSTVRTVHLARHLDQLGHQVSVLTYDERALTLFSAPDPDLAAKVPASVHVYRIPAGPLRRRLIAKKEKQANAAIKYKEAGKQHPLISLLIPDPHVDSLLSFVAAGSGLVHSLDPDLVLTHGYPFTAHVVGYLLKKRFPRLRWAADYGDPWSGNPTGELFRPPWRKRLDYRMERCMLRAADKVLVTTEPTRDLYEQLFPGVRGKIHVVPMGFDPEDFAAKPIERDRDQAQKIWIVHTGRLYRQARDPEPFVRALDALCREDPETANRLSIYLVGEIDQGTRSLIEASAAASIVEFVPWVPVQTSIAWMKAADYLLLFGNRGDIQVPGKVYQYLGADKPILMICESRRDPTCAIVRAREGSVLVPNNAASIKAALADVMGRPAGVRDRRAEVALEASVYSWPSIARQVSEIISHTP